MTSILLVEDEIRLAAAIRKGLRAEGFAVDVATNGVDGEWLAREKPYDAIVLDVMLPQRDGYQVCENLRSTGDWTPILILTARGSPKDEVHSLNSGADDFLAKPFSFAVLVARLRSLLRRGASKRPPILEVGELVLDPATFRCSRAGRQIELTSREFAVLEFLMRREGEVLSKAEILDNVWDFSFDGDPNIVEVYIRRLRSKVDDPFEMHSIQTKRGAGYRLTGDE